MTTDLGKIISNNSDIGSDEALAALFARALTSTNTIGDQSEAFCNLIAEATNTDRATSPVFLTTKQTQQLLLLIAPKETPPSDELRYLSLMLIQTCASNHILDPLAIPFLTESLKQLDRDLPKGSLAKQQIKEILPALQWEASPLLALHLNEATPAATIQKLAMAYPGMSSDEKMLTLRHLDNALITTPELADPALFRLIILDAIKDTNAIELKKQALHVIRTSLHCNPKTARIIDANLQSLKQENVPIDQNFYAVLRQVLKEYEGPHKLPIITHIQAYRPDRRHALSLHALPGRLRA